MNSDDTTTAGAYVNGSAQVTVGGVLTNNVTNQTLTVTQASLNKAASRAHGDRLRRHLDTHLHDRERRG